MLDHSGWSAGIAKRFQEYAFKSIGLSWMYGNDAAHYNSIHNKTNIIIGILAAISSIGITSIFAFVDNRQCSVPNVGFYIVTSISILLNVTIGILNRYQGSMNFEHRVPDFSEKSAKYGSLYRKIINEFEKDPEARGNALTMLANVEQRFEELDREKPFIRDKTVNEWGNYLDTFNTNKVNMDVIVSIPEDLADESMIASREIVGEKNNYNNCAIRINAT